MEFRKLRAEEIDCRVKTVSAKGCMLLLYKDARADMNILDETVGPERWQRHHELINGNLFCNVGINFPGPDGFERWVWKQDVGVESNTEKEKGQASDSFKRACVNWGIGRELYTAPMIWVFQDCVNLKQDSNGRWLTYDKFYVSEIEYQSGNISRLVIVNESFGKTAFTFGEKTLKKDDALEGAKDRARVLGFINRHKVNLDEFLAYYKITSINDFNPEMARHYIEGIAKKGKSIDE